MGFICWDVPEHADWAHRVGHQGRKTYKRSFKGRGGGVLLLHSGQMIWLVSVEVLVQSLAQHCGLRIQLWHRSQTRLRFDPWHGNFYMSQKHLKKKKKKERNLAVILAGGGMEAVGDASYVLVGCKME